VRNSRQIPSRSEVGEDTPLRLAVAAALAYPDGSMTVSGLHTAIDLNATRHFLILVRNRIRSDLRTSLSPQVKGLTTAAGCPGCSRTWRQQRRHLAMSVTYYCLMLIVAQHFWNFSDGSCVI